MDNGSKICKSQGSTEKKCRSMYGQGCLTEYMGKREQKISVFLRKEYCENFYQQKLTKTKM